MSQDNVELVRRAIEAAARHPLDWATAARLFDRKHELVEQTDFVEFQGTRIGEEGFRGWRAMMDQTGDWRVEVEDARAVPDGRVAVLIRFFMKGEHSRASAEHKMCLLCCVEDARITRTESFAGWDDPLKAVGLEE